MNTTNIGKYKVNYINSKEFHILKNEIFGNECYKVNIKKEKPYIIDAGAHIGLSVIYFKSIYPDAEILAFEPNPYTRKILKENIFINNLNNIEVLPYALDSSERERDFYIDMTPSQWQSTAGFNKNSWNGQYSNNTSVKVQTKKLSTYLDRSADLLKMDIEGLETKVLTESKDLLKNVNHIIIEYHPIKKKNFNIITNLLKDSGFKISIFKDGKEVKNTNYKELLIVKGDRV
jgi:FkbM family methyltransferase